MARAKTQNQKDTKAQKTGPIIVAQIMGKWVGGGVESVIMNYYRHIDRSKIQFDFICDEDSTNIPYDEIEKLGGKVILCPPYQKLPKYLKFLKQLFREKKYRIVHSNINTLSVFPLYAAKKAGVPVRIAHSHSTSNPREWKKNLLKNALRPLSKKYATEYFACSELAGRYLFGDKTFDKGEVKVIRNAIDVEKFKFDPEARKKLRKEIGINDGDFVIGHIGRFVEQKNHRYLIDIFVEVKKEKKNAKLVLVGQGPLLEEIKEKVKSLGLEKDVFFLGQRNDTDKLYSVFDVFCLPSLYEGLPVVGVEAQANGVPCVFSDRITKETVVNKNVKLIDIKESAEKTAKSVLMCGRRIKIGDYPFDIKQQTRTITEQYFLYKGTELFGLPGSGKTYYCQNRFDEEIILNSKLQSNSRSIRNIKRLFFAFNFMRRNKNKVASIKNAFKEITFEDRIKKIKMMLWLFSILFCIENNKNSHYIMDEGVFQALWAIYYNSSDLDMNDDLFRVLSDYFPDEVIVLKVDDEIVKERLMKRNNRGGSELEHDMKIKEDDTPLKKARFIEKCILKLIMTSTNVCVEYFDAKDLDNGR